MRSRTLLMAVALLAMPALASAHQYDYTYFDGGFISRDSDRDRNDDFGLRLTGSADITTTPIALFGEYVGAGDFDHLTAGAMFHTPIADYVDINVGASLEHERIPNDSDTGLGLRAGLRWVFLDNRLELDPEVIHERIFNTTDTSLRGGVLYRLMPQLDLAGALQVGDEDRAELGLRYNFGTPNGYRRSY